MRSERSPEPTAAARGGPRAIELLARGRRAGCAQTHRLARLLVLERSACIKRQPVRGSGGSGFRLIGLRAASTARARV